MPEHRLLYTINRAKEYFKDYKIRATKSTGAGRPRRRS